MGDQLEAGRFDQVADALRRRQAAAPGDVRLQHLGGAEPHQHLETVLRVLVLAAGHLRPAGTASADLLDQFGVAEDVVRGEQLLHEVEVRRAKTLRDADRPVDGAVARDAVRHQVALRPHRLAGGEDVVGPLIGFVLGTVRADRQDPLEVANAESLAGGDVAAGLVDGDAVAWTSAEQRVNRLAGVLALDVPERRVDGGERHREDAAPAVEHRRAVHLVPELIDVEGVRADQEVLEMAVDDLDRGAAAGAHAEAGDPGVRLDDRDDR